MFLCNLWPLMTSIILWVERTQGCAFDASDGTCNIDHNTFIKKCTTNLTYTQRISSRLQTCYGHLIDHLHNYSIVTKVRGNTSVSCTGSFSLGIVMKDMRYTFQYVGEIDNVAQYKIVSGSPHDDGYVSYVQSPASTVTRLVTDTGAAEVAAFCFDERVADNLYIIMLSSCQGQCQHASNNLQRFIGDSATFVRLDLQTTSLSQNLFVLCRQAGQHAHVRLSYGTVNANFCQPYANSHIYKHYGDNTCGSRHTSTTDASAMRHVYVEMSMNSVDQLNLARLTVSCQKNVVIPVVAPTVAVFLVASLITVICLVVRIRERNRTKPDEHTNSDTVAPPAVTATHQQHSNHTYTHRSPASDDVLHYISDSSPLSDNYTNSKIHNLQQTKYPNEDVYKEPTRKLQHSRTGDKDDDDGDDVIMRDNAMYTCIPHGGDEGQARGQYDEATDMPEQSFDRHAHTNSVYIENNDLYTASI